MMSVTTPIVTNTTETVLQNKIKLQQVEIEILKTFASIEQEKNKRLNLRLKKYETIHRVDQFQIMKMINLRKIKF
tara:strand:- start:460 stop:684 length:225 start_codon:yes stop_codon:yes gene_type:complete